MKSNKKVDNKSDRADRSLLKVQFRANFIDIVEHLQRLPFSSPFQGPPAAELGQELPGEDTTRGMIRGQPLQPSSFHFHVIYE